MALLRADRGRGVPTDPARWDSGDEPEARDERTAQSMQSGPGGGGGRAAVTRWAPSVAIEETNDTWLVEAELPGAEPEDITVRVSGHRLAIHAETSEPERTGIVDRRRRLASTFDCRLDLPTDVEPDRVEADLEHGLLSVRVPKRARSSPARDPDGDGPSSIADDPPASEALLDRLTNGRRHVPGRASFDATEVEDACYRAIYARRSGTVERVARGGGS